MNYRLKFGCSCLIATVVCLLPLSCTNQEDLGDNFMLTRADKDDVYVIYCFQDCSVSGIPVIPPKVVRIDHDAKWIVAKVREVESDTASYWIVDKDIDAEFEYDTGFTDLVQSHVQGPMDSTQFASTVDGMGVNLNLR